jgi:methylated-DNA-[protein]-cysteine S-methyltransferase
VNETTSPGVVAVWQAPFARLRLEIRGGALVDLDIAESAELQAPTDALAQEAARQLQAYFADARHVFSLPLDLGGTEFQRRVWQALRQIPPGQTRGYGDLARQLGTSPRAVGNACRANPVAIIIPCHRVVGVHGLTGYMGNQGNALEYKRWLLTHEGATLPLIKQ